MIRMARRVIQKQARLSTALRNRIVAVHSRHSISQAGSGHLQCTITVRLDHIPYVLITPARNEDKHIEDSSIHDSQTVLPAKWVIVNDGSTDGTASIVGQYLRNITWIELVNLPYATGANFAAKVHAFNAGQRKSRISNTKSSAIWIRMFRWRKTISNFS